MNCKPGDLARMVRSDFPENVNKLVWVREKAPTFVGEGWMVELLQPMKTTFGWKPAGSIGSAADTDLRPIRDPGDDAVDEMLVLLGSPAKETA